MFIEFNNAIQFFNLILILFVHTINATKSHIYIQIAFFNLKISPISCANRNRIKLQVLSTFNMYEKPFSN
jgi:hypothetical protein